MGFRMPGWYDILSFDDLHSSEDDKGIIRSQQYFHSLIKAEIDKGIPSERIVLGGFSQGGAISLLSGVTCPTKLGGIFGLSCYLLLRGKIKEMVPKENPNKVRLVLYPGTLHDTPIFMGHGDADQTVRYDWGKQTAEKLKGWGWNVDFRTYKGLQHSADPDEIDHLEAYLKERLPPLGDKADGATASASKQSL
ncbi:hypothetical protein LTR66_002482 [Elasticomyces elasticus]|nr:hypothetical protein LTR66_002482 [Elasticomyces elasticus]